ncbi:ethanolamine-phosphate cytidylyltransferase [Hortaea werneckii]|nr:ethanolamine-phosphate cytidylyltransferase [Hortaea werneckii]
MSPTHDPEAGCLVPEPGNWPVPPQDDQEILEDRLWIDGCFDFFHHGHAGVMLQSRRLGNQLVVGLHNDEDIAANKGPTVMSLAERVAAVEACRFSTKCVPHAPYVTSQPWISHYGCQYVTHGDDITSDADGNDCYRFVKKAGRMKIVPRTPGISTTDLVGRMLLCTKDHFIHSLTDSIAGAEGNGSEEERRSRGAEMEKRFREYAAAHNGKDPYVSVDSFQPQHPEQTGSTSIDGNDQHHDLGKGSFKSLVPGHGPRPGQRIVYVDGGFDLFSSGHIAFLRTVTEMEHEIAKNRGWYAPAEVKQRLNAHGEDYPSAYVIAGIHSDDVVNYHKGINYPIMNIFERGLCVTQCRYIHAVAFGAPYVPTKAYLHSLPGLSEAGKQPPDAVYHGKTSFMPPINPAEPDPYKDAKDLGIFVEAPEHEFQGVNAAQIVKRILDRRAEYEERQKRKGMKGVGEGALRREEMEKETEAERERRARNVGVQ